jgi:hypothetical protein
MGYIPRTYTLTVEIRDGVAWNSNDTDYVAARMEALGYELEKIVVNKFTVKNESD